MDESPKVGRGASSLCNPHGTATRTVGEKFTEQLQKTVEIPL